LVKLKHKEIHICELDRQFVRLVLFSSYFLRLTSTSLPINFKRFRLFKLLSILTVYCTLTGLGIRFDLEVLLRRLSFLYLVEVGYFLTLGPLLPGFIIFIGVNPTHTSSHAIGRVMSSGSLKLKKHKFGII
jgi:hypothetical protein